MIRTNDRGALITSPIPYLDEGLFGRVYLWILEVLPYLRENNIYPDWKIRSSLYGVGDQKIAIPGILDIAYSVPNNIAEEMSLVDLRNNHSSFLGSSWHEINKLWTSYFTIPRRIYDAADKIPVTASTLGIHYRGTDKIVSSWDSNMLSKQDMLVLVEDYLSAHPNAKSIFLATDEDEFVQMLKNKVRCEVISLGGAKHHKNDVDAERIDYRDADRANLDCVLLSRCGGVLLTSSALSAFAKILNPGLAIFRCAASKMLWDGPYFPVAHIPVYMARSEEARKILSRTLADDWRDEPHAKKFFGSFVAKPNWPWRRRAFKRSTKRHLRRLLGQRDESPISFFYR